MSINLPTHYVMQFSTNVNLLLQQKGSKLRDCVTSASYVGKQASPVDQIGSIEANRVTTRFEDMPRTDAPTDRRWIYPVDYDVNQMVDSLDKLRMITDPSSVYVTNATYALGRKMDYEICTAFTGTAKTGEQGATSTSFTSGNEVDVAVGGANSKLNVAKIKEVKRLMMTNHIDFDTEQAYIGITAYDHDSLLSEVQVISSDFNGGKPVLHEGRVVSLLEFQFKHCELIETVLAGTNEVTLPVWVKSGMHLGIWNDIKADVSQRKDLRNHPWQAYVVGTFGATRLEEKKVYAIESYRA